MRKPLPDDTDDQAGMFDSWWAVRHPDKPLIHGITGTYQRGCRCRPCKNANNEYHRAYRLPAASPASLDEVL
jgi:hypothetical protein